jgi:hypothetical protein
MLEPDKLEEWVQGVVRESGPAGREVVSTFVRRFAVCEALLEALAKVPPYGWTDWGRRRFLCDGKTGKRITEEQLIAGTMRRSSETDPVAWAFIYYRDLLFSIQDIHGRGGRLRKTSPARHERPGSRGRRPTTALDAVDTCPIVGIECVEAGRALLIEARADILSKYEDALDSLPKESALRAPTMHGSRHGRLKTKNGELPITARKILSALEKPADGWKNVARIAELSLDEVKHWSADLQSNGLIERVVVGRPIARTAAGASALNRKNESGPTERPTERPTVAPPT